MEQFEMLERNRAMSPAKQVSIYTKSISRIVCNHDTLLLRII